MNRNEYFDLFQVYVSNMKKIRVLATPDIKDITRSEQYYEILSRNFIEIGELSEINKKLVDEYLKPVLSDKIAISDEIKEQMMSFIAMLVENNRFKEVDVHLSEILSEILLSEDDASQAADENSHVISMANKVKSDYFVISGLTRYYNQNTLKARKMALDNRNELAGYLEKDVFCTLSDEAKGMALQFSLMGALLYENNLYLMPEAYWQKCIDIIETANSIVNDPFYRESFPDYDWESYEFRIYYYGSFLAYSILPQSIAKKAYDYAQKALQFLKNCTNETIIQAVDEEQERDLLYLASVQAGYVSARDACDAFYDAYAKRDSTDYSITGINKNLDTPSSYLCTSKILKLQLNERDYDRYMEIEKSVLDYLYKIPKKSDKYLKCVTILVNFPIYFREVPNAMTLEEFCLNAFAATHPPTYIHINMVARLSECLTRHLLKLHPEYLIGFPGCDTTDKVTEDTDRILNYTYHAALCHDIGKLFIIDTISMYGRYLFDDEIALIKNHPDTGARIAAEYASTRDYVDVIKGHHVWYDCSNGYPGDFDTSKSKYKTIIDIVMAADCLDAATDRVGRSYNKGKDISEYGKEIREGAGTHYAPFLVELLDNDAVRKDIEYLLSEGRRKIYEETFLRLKHNEVE